VDDQATGFAVNMSKLNMSKLTAQVITVSTRGSQGLRADTSGEILVTALTELGLVCSPTVIIADGPEVATEIVRAVGTGHSLIVTTGGTGISPTDQTPEFTRSVIDREIPGIAEAIRAYGRGNGIATASLSRGIAGQLANSLVINVPGSPGGARDAAAVLRDIVIHALEQMAGSDH
jgi:molybdenum cofactor synthesis domain-containing protein